MKDQTLLHIQDLHVQVGEQPILQGLDLTLRSGEVHILMGRNGQGKTTVAQILAGAPRYEVSEGSISYQGHDLLRCAPEERAALGLFVGFQQPIAIPGVSIISFLKAAVDALAKARGQAPMPAPALLSLVREKMAQLGLDPAFLSRSLNEGFSGGEKKRVELLQMAVLCPTLAILDEPDSGLDADALQRLGHMLQTMRKSERALLIITHYTHLFEYLTPDYVHILDQGRIVQSGDASLAARLLQEGYDALLNPELPQHAS